MNFFRIVILPLVFAVFLMSPAHATTIISPVIEITVDPGTSQQGAVKVYNETNHDLTVTASIDAVRGGEEQGGVIFDTDRPAFLSWITLDRTSLTLKPQQAAIVPLSVQVPKNARPGGYYAAVFWQETSLIDSKKNVGIHGRVGTLVFLTVTGAVTEQATIDSFGIEPQRSVVFGVPLTFSTRVTNQGNIHFQPIGNIILTNWLGRKISLSVNPERRSIMPGSTRRFDVVWPSTQSSGNWWRRQWETLVAEVNYLTIGPYRAELTLEYGKSAPHTVNATTSFIIIPMHLIGAGVLVGIFLVIGWRINRWVVKLKRQKPLV